MRRGRRAVSPVVHVVAQEVLSCFEDESSSQALRLSTRSLKRRIRCLERGVNRVAGTGRRVSHRFG